ncbi:MAG: hypothetical protein QM773_13640 [Hyphomonadaceae bacterium]
MGLQRRISLAVLAALIAIPLLALLYDSRWNAETYRCDGARSVTLHPNIPGYAIAGEIRLEGSVTRGSATIIQFPGDEALAPPQRYTAGSSVSQSYTGDLYDPINITFDSTAGSNCELRLTYRVKAGLSLVNPLW